MKLALIPPVELLEYTEETDMQLMLPHMLKNDIYRYVYQKHCSDPRQYVILDNGAAEDELVTTEELVRIALEYGVDEIVAPDVIQDGDGTMDSYLKFRLWLLENDVYLGPMKIMYVLQGKDIWEFYDQAQVVMDLANPPDVIGLPRHMLTTCNDRLARGKLAKAIYEVQKRKNVYERMEVHLLGANPDYPTELQDFTTAKRQVRSTDTSAAFNYAHHGHLLSVNHRGVRRPEHYFERPYTQFDLDILDKNVAKLKRWTHQP